MVAGKKFELLCAELPEFPGNPLASVQRIALRVHAELESCSADVEGAQTQELPTGLGVLTAQILDREIGDWGRFKNRRQVASYTGLVPSEHSSGAHRQRGAITKHGNPRVRHIPIEASWRLQHVQPDYRASKLRQAAFDTAKRKGAKAARKKLCVGLARQFIVDWWRIRTGRTTPQKLGLHLSWPTAYVLRGKGGQPHGAQKFRSAAGPAMGRSLRGPPLTRFRCDDAHYWRVSRWGRTEVRPTCRGGRPSRRRG